MVDHDGLRGPRAEPCRGVIELNPRAGIDDHDRLGVGAARRIERHPGAGVVNAMWRVTDETWGPTRKRRHIPRRRVHFTCWSVRTSASVEPSASPSGRACVRIVTPRAARSVSATFPGVIVLVQPGVTS